MKARRQQAGVALIMVLWVTALLAIVAGSYAMVARSAYLQSRYTFEVTRARLAAEAGMNRAVFELRNPDFASRWIADGRVYEMGFDGVKLRINVVDETGKIDLNAASPDILRRLFAAVGVDESQQQSLADAVVDWRDADNLRSLNGAEDDDYADAGYPYGARDEPFATVEELQQVLGMNYALYKKVESAVTVFSGRNNVNAAVAPELALMAMPDITRQQAQDFIARRLASSANDSLTFGSQQVRTAPAGGLTFSVHVAAILPDGVQSDLETTLRLRGGGAGARAFTVLRWRSGIVATSADSTAAANDPEQGT